MLHFTSKKSLNKKRVSMLHFTSKKSLNANRVSMLHFTSLKKVWMRSDTWCCILLLNKFECESSFEGLKICEPFLICKSKLVKKSGKTKFTVFPQNASAFLCFFLKEQRMAWNLEKKKVTLCMKFSSSSSVHFSFFCVLTKRMKDARI